MNKAEKILIEDAIRCNLPSEHEAACYGGNHKEQKEYTTLMVNEIENSLAIVGLKIKLVNINET